MEDGGSGARCTAKGSDPSLHGCAPGDSCHSLSLFSKVGHVSYPCPEHIEERTANGSDSKALGKYKVRMCKD